MTRVTNTDFAVNPVCLLLNNGQKEVDLESCYMAFMYIANNCTPNDGSILHIHVYVYI